MRGMKSRIRRAALLTVVVGMMALSVTCPATAADRSATSATSAPAPFAALEVTVDHPEYVAVGESAAYTITVRNTGTAPLVDLAVTDTFLGDVGSAAALEPGESVVFHAQRELDEPAQGFCTATARTEQGESVSAQAEHLVDVAAVDSFPDYALDKFALSASALPGAVVTFRLVYRNLEEDPPGAASVTIVDTFDARWLEIVDAAGGQVAPGRITWSPTSLRPGESPRTIEYRLRIKPGAPAGARLVNTAVVQAHGDDSGAEAANNTGVATVLVAAAPVVPTQGSTAQTQGTTGAAQSSAQATARSAETTTAPFLPFTGPSPFVPIAGLACGLLGMLLRRAAAAA